MKNFSLPTTKSSIVAFLHRFHLVLFVVIVIGSLAYAILSVNRILEQSSQSDLTQAPSSQFDTDTIKRVDQLHTSSEADSFTLPAGRTNPFVE